MTATTEPLTIENGLEIAETWSWLIDGLALPAKREGETDGEWTGRIHRSGNKIGRNRQCSIGWHDECSDGDECECPCHEPGADVSRTVLALAYFRDLMREMAPQEAADVADIRTLRGAIHDALDELEAGKQYDAEAILRRAVEGTLR